MYQYFKRFFFFVTLGSTFLFALVNFDNVDALTWQSKSGFVGTCQGGPSSPANGDSCSTLGDTTTCYSNVTGGGGCGMMQTFVTPLNCECLY